VSRLPIPGGDDGTWGGILNDFLSQSLNSDGSLKPSSVAAAGAEQTSKKGLPNGYAGLNGNGLVVTGELGTGTANTTTYLRGDGSWQTPPAGGSSTLASDSDVSISSPSSNQVLTWNGSTWVNQAPLVSSVAGRGGNVVLTAADVSGVEATVNKDAANGYAGLDSNTLLKVSEMPRALGVVVDLGTNNTGTVTCDLSLGIAFKVVLTQNTTISFANWPAFGLVEPEVYVVQDATGGHSISLPSVTWEPTGSPPTFNTSPNAVNIIPIASFNGGLNAYGLTGLQGPVGPTGATGPTGPAGATSPEAYLGWVVPISTGSPRINTTQAIGTAFRAFFQRVIIPKTGTLHDLAIFNGSTVAGNHNVAVYDTGDASAGHYTPLWSSGSVAATGTNSWQVVGDPALSVTAGQQLLLSFMNDSTTTTFGIGSAYSLSAAAQLPTNFIPTAGGALPKLIGTFTFGSLAYSTLTEANLSASPNPYMVIARIA